MDRTERLVADAVLREAQELELDRRRQDFKAFEAAVTNGIGRAFKNS